MRVERGIGKAKATSRFANLTPAERRRESGERGSTLLEFAMVAMITLVLMFGMIDLARALYSYHFVTTAAREGARFASVRGALCSSSVNPPPCPAFQGDVQAFVTAITPQGIDASQVQVQPNIFSNPNNLPVCGTVQNYPGCGVQVTVRYAFSFIFPANLYNLSPTIQMSSTSEMIISR